MIIGLMGYAGAGKDYVGNILVEDFGFKRASFADTLKEFVLEHYKHLKPYDVYDPQGKESPVSTTLYIDDLAQFLYAKFGKPPQLPEGLPEFVRCYTPRELLQHVGLYAREWLGEDIWVDNIKYDDTQDTVITDVRFNNECNWVKGNLGYLVLVDNKYVDRRSMHVSENVPHDYADFIVPNTLASKEFLEKELSKIIYIINN
jgi:hypothetical protein